MKSSESSVQNQSSLSEQQNAPFSQRQKDVFQALKEQNLLEQKLKYLKTQQQIQEGKAKKIEFQRQKEQQAKEQYERQKQELQRKKEEEQQKMQQQRQLVSSRISELKRSNTDKQKQLEQQKKQQYKQVVKQQQQLSLQKNTQQQQFRAKTSDMHDSVAEYDKQIQDRKSQLQSKRIEEIKRQRELDAEALENKGIKAVSKIQSMIQKQEQLLREIEEKNKILRQVQEVEVRKVRVKVNPQAKQLHAGKQAKE